MMEALKNLKILLFFVLRADMTSSIMVYTMCLKAMPYNYKYQNSLGKHTNINLILKHLIQLSAKGAKACWKFNVQLKI